MSRNNRDAGKPIAGNGAWALYCQNKRERNNYTFRIDCNGEGYYLVDGERLTEQEFNCRFPIGLIDRTHDKVRLDSRQNLF